MDSTQKNISKNKPIVNIDAYCNKIFELSR